MMQQKQIEKIQESQKNRAYHEEKIKKALDKNESELMKKREVLSFFNSFVDFFFKKIQGLRK